MKKLLLVLIALFAIQLDARMFYLHCKSTRLPFTIGLPGAPEKIGSVENPYYKDLGIGNMAECDIYEYTTITPEEQTGLSLTSQVARNGMGFRK